MAYVWRHLGERFAYVNVVNRVPHGGSGVMVWAGISYGQRTQLHFIDGNLNATTSAEVGSSPWSGLLAIVDPFFIFHLFCLVFPHAWVQSPHLLVVYLTLCSPPPWDCLL